MADSDGTWLDYTPIIGAGLSSIGNVASTKKTNEALLKIAQMTNQTNIDIANAANDLTVSENQKSREYNSSEAEKAYQREIDKMRLQHQLNSPLELVRQMREAGLNPQFAYNMNGAGSVGNTSAPVGSTSLGFSPAVPNVVSPSFRGWPNVFDGLGDAAYKSALIHKTMADSKKTTQETKDLVATADNRYREQAAKTKLAEITSDLQAKFGEDWQKLGLAEKQKQIEVLVESAYELHVRGLDEQADRELKLAQKELNEALAKTEGEKYKKLQIEVASWREMIDSEIYNNRSSGDLNSSQARLNSANETYVIARAWNQNNKNTIIKNLQKDLDEVTGFFKGDNKFWQGYPQSGSADEKGQYIWNYVKKGGSKLITDLFNSVPMIFNGVSMKF